MPLLIDCHNHSKYSFDGREQIADICIRAEELGLTAFAVTDHCDLYPPRYDFDNLKRNICNSVDEVSAFRREHDTRVQLLTGVELAEAVDYPDAADEVLAMRDMDVIIGSIHRVSGIEDFYFLDCENTPYEKHLLLMDEYFERIQRMAEWGKFDVLAHLTYPLRYITGNAGIKLPMERWQSQIDRIFGTIMEKHIALEVNTSGMFQKIGEPAPNEALVRRYYDLGGRLISVGSDAHYIDHISRGVLSAQEMLRKIGFTEVCYFVRHEPHYVKL